MKMNQILTILASNPASTLKFIYSINT